LRRGFLGGISGSESGVWVVVVVAVFTRLGVEFGRFVRSEVGDSRKILSRLVGGANLEDGGVRRIVESLFARLATGRWTASWEMWEAWVVFEL